MKYGKKDVLPLAYSTEQMPVKITIHTTIWSDGEKQTVEFTTEGQFYKKTNANFIQYEEVHEEGKMNTIVKFTAQEIMIIRSGTLKMRLRFMENKQIEGVYHTPYGNLAVSTVTKELKNSFDQTERAGTVEILYDLMMDRAHAGTYHMVVTFKEARK